MKKFELLNTIYPSISHEGKHWYPILPKKSAQNWFCTHLRNHRHDNRDASVNESDRAYRIWMNRSDEREYLSKFTFSLENEKLKLFSFSAKWPDLALLPRWWGKKVDSMQSWRRHFRTLKRRDGTKPDMARITIPKDVGLYFMPPEVFCHLPNGKFLDGFHFRWF